MFASVEAFIMTTEGSGSAVLTDPAASGVLLNRSLGLAILIRFDNLYWSILFSLDLSQT